jgi:pSer/pThr/pTyr-binding forkhead associated (FHA) protein
MASLEVVSGRSGGKSLELDSDGEWLVGTNRRAQLRLTDRGVSYSHATVYAEAGQFTIVDERSTAGTFLNDDPLDRQTPYTLKSGDSIKFGENVEVAFSCESRTERSASGRLGVMTKAAAELHHVDDLREQLADTEEELSRAIEESAALRIELETLRATVAASDSLEEALAAATTELEKAQSTAREHDAQVDRLRQNLEETHSERERLTLRLEALEPKADEHPSKTEDLEAALSAAQEETAKAVADLVDARSEAEEFRVQVDEINEEMVELQNELDQLKGN